ncbi:MAG TPA: hypothetical protein VGB74_10740 [Actinoplanes sp.]
MPARAARRCAALEGGLVPVDSTTAGLGGRGTAVVWRVPIVG